MGKVIYYCNCTVDHSSEADKGKTPLRVVQADLDGICTNCGHYAVASTKDIKQVSDIYEN